MERCTIKRRSEVHRCPAVPAAENAAARTTSAKSADGQTMAALLPPSSSRERLNCAAQAIFTARPMVVDPVALTSLTAGWATNASPTERSPVNNSARPSVSSPCSRAVCNSRPLSASAHKGAFSDGFQTRVLPHTSASAAFQAKTAIGKLNAEIMPTTPSGCQVSSSLWSGRSLAMVKP